MGLGFDCFLIRVVVLGDLGWVLDCSAVGAGFRLGLRVGFFVVVGWFVLALSLRIC